MVARLTPEELANELEHVRMTARRYLEEAGLDRNPNRPGRYISVPTEIDAVQFNGENFASVRELAGKKDYMGGFSWAFQPIGTYLVDYLNPEAKAELWVEANSSWVPIEIGEWILKDDLGCYPCKNDIFKRKYRENI